MIDPIVQATNQHHAEEADYQRRYDAMVEEIYADLPAHLDEIVEFTDAQAALIKLMSLHVIHPKDRDYSSNIYFTLERLMHTAVHKIVERRLE